MTGIAEFKIIGRVGAIKDVGTTVRVSIAANYSYQDKRANGPTTSSGMKLRSSVRQLRVRQEKLTKGDLVTRMEISGKPATSATANGSME